MFGSDWCFVCASAAVPTFTSTVPLRIPASSGVVVVVSGSFLQDVSGDALAFVVSSSVCGSSVSGVTDVSTSSSAPTMGGSVMNVTVNALNAATGTYWLCARW